MTTLEKLFKDLNTFRSYVSGVDTSTTFLELDSSAKSATKRIIIILTREVYDNVVAKADEEQHEALLTALANLTMANQLPHEVVKMRKSEVDMYKSEQEAIMRSYIENYYNAMDTLISLLESSNDESWKKSRYCALISSLEIRTADDFDLLYNIDLSYLFFFRCATLQKEVLDEGLKQYFNRCRDNADITELLKRILAKKTVVLALRRFDITEFPSTIRNLFNDSSASRNGTEEQKRMLSLADQLLAEADQLLTSVDMLLSKDENGVIDTDTDFNECDDKIILMP